MDIKEESNSFHIVKTEQDSSKVPEDNIPNHKQVGNVKQEDVIVKDENFPVPSLKLNYREKNQGSPNKPFACKYCNYSSSARAHLTYHIRTHTGEKPYACDLCNYKAGKEINLKTHMRVHTGEKPFACNLCDYKAARKAALRFHTTIHTGNRPFACNLCEYKAAEKSALKTHMITHSNKRPFPCHLCSYKTVTKHSLKIHMVTHTGEKPFKCNLCDYKSAHKAHLGRHMNVHANPVTVMPLEAVTIKEEIFDDNEAVINSTSNFLHVNIKEDCLITEPSSPSASSNITIPKHNSIDNQCLDIPNPEPFEELQIKTESDPDQTSSNPSNLNLKLNKPFQCSECDYKCKQKNRLQEHLKTHTGEKTFKCKLYPEESFTTTY